MVVEATENQRASQFAEGGYAVIEGFLDGRLVEALRQAVEAVLAAPPVPGCERPHNRLVSLRWNDDAVRLILANRGRRRAIAAVTGGDDLRWISGYVSVKEPHTPALAWHQDWWCWDHPVSLRPIAPQVAVLSYLTDTSERNGALRVLPRSHHTSVPLHARLPDAHSTDAEPAPDCVALSNQPGQVTLSARSGDAVILDYRLLHGTHPNTSAERRDCLLLSFTPSWRGLPADVRAHLIQHLALPGNDERAPRTGWRGELLPIFEGVRADLELNRVPPTRFKLPVER